jgi:ABC-type transporter Mla maintaining outer membrane lipid asymmetry ATPase subunit MlaF
LPAAPADAAPNAVELADVSFGYDRRRPVLRGITMAIPRGKVVAIMGGSGSGKTTILRLIGGQLRAQTGKVLVQVSRCAIFRATSSSPFAGESGCCSSLVRCSPT